MRHRRDRSAYPQQRSSIASAAARLIAEEGITDYAFAKRKAARKLGLPDTTPMPDNAEIEEELRIHQRLFQSVEQNERVQRLRRHAARLMGMLEDFSPYLTGSVLDGTAGRYAEIDIQLFADSAKEIEIFLLNQQIDYEHREPRTDRAEAVLAIDLGDAIANLVIYPPREERVTLRTRDGRVRERARLPALEALLA
ncbi:MAG TPA: hypothetical protein PLW86_03675 [Rhodocyclaceae bacterium]|nr:hypothetical protein [Rhodocyclaceae bacterium]